MFSLIRGQSGSENPAAPQSPGYLRCGHLPNPRRPSPRRSLQVPRWCVRCLPETFHQGAEGDHHPLWSGCPVVHFRSWGDHLPRDRPHQAARIRYMKWIPLFCFFRPYEVGIRLIYSLSISRQTDWIGRASSPGAFQEAGFVPGGFQLHPVPGNSDLQPSHRLQRSAAQPGATAGQQHHPLATLRQRHLQGSAGRDAWLTVRLLDIRWCNGGRTLWFNGSSCHSIPSCLQALSESFSGDIPDEHMTSNSFFPDEYFTCSSLCLSCGYVSLFSLQHCVL